MDGSAAPRVWTVVFLARGTLSGSRLAKRLRRAGPKTGERRSLRAISAMLAEAGHLNEHGRLFNPRSIKAMVEG